MEGGLPLPDLLHSPRQTAGVLCGYVSYKVLCFSFKFHIILHFLDNFMQEIGSKRKLYARDAYLHSALNFCVPCLMQDLRTNSGMLSRTISMSSKQSDTERHVRFSEPAYSFVGMHCIFDNCKTSGYFLWTCGHAMHFFLFQWSSVLVWLIWAVYYSSH